MSAGKRLDQPHDDVETLELVVHGMSHDGEGVGRVSGLAVFVPGGVPGDRLRVRLVERRRRYARAAIVGIASASPDRVEPRCPVAGICGGCQLQHVDYARQLDLKRQQVADALRRIGKLAGVTVHPVLGMDSPWEYRNRGQFPAGAKDGCFHLGLFAPGTHEVVDIPYCVIHHPLVNRIVKEAQDAANAFGVTAYDRRRDAGQLRHVVARVGFATGEAMAILVTRHRDFPAGPRMAEYLMDRIPQLVSVVHNINPARTSTVLGRRSRILAGRGYIVDRLAGFQFMISPHSFFQVNNAQTERLYETVLRYADLTGTETVVDVYCGIGTISLLLAKHALSVIGVESVSDAVYDARSNAERNNIDNAEFIAGDSAAVLPGFAAEGKSADVVVMDPPRQGCAQAVLDAVAAIDPRRIVYVSCNPATLARDLARLEEHGYRTQEVQPVDMFPHTSHVECCALLTKG